MTEYEIISIVNKPDAIDVTYKNNITKEQLTKTIHKNSKTPLKQTTVADLIRAIEDLITQVK